MCHIKKSICIWTLLLTNFLLVWISSLDDNGNTSFVCKMWTKVLNVILLWLKKVYIGEGPKLHKTFIFYITNTPSWFPLFFNCIERIIANSLDTDVKLLVLDHENMTGKSKWEVVWEHKKREVRCLLIAGYKVFSNMLLLV